jgi:pilus assembly protein Flp/PilA
MRKIVSRKFVSRFAKDESGAALVEYGILVGLIAVVCIAAVTLLGNTIQDVYNVIAADLTAAF